MGIYSYELFNFYDIDNIIRIGTAGSIHPDLKIRNVVLAMGACTDSNYGAQYELPGTFAPIASFELLRKAVKVIEEMGNIGYKVGNVVSSDVFYMRPPDDGSMAEDGSAGNRDGVCGTLYECGARRQECADDLHDLRQPCDRRGDDCRRASDEL